MIRSNRRFALVPVLLGILLTIQTDFVQAGKVELKSAGPLAFAPEGVLLIGDPKAATIYAVETDDVKGLAKPINVENVGKKIANMLGVAQDQMAIADMAVNPATGKLFLSVSRGTGPDASAVILHVDSEGNVAEFSLEDVDHKKAVLPNAPEDKLVGQGRRRRNNRTESITDLAFLDNRVIVAGLTNEEFASNLRTINYPFDEVTTGASIEIYHGAHGAFETRSPVRTFVPMNLEGDPHIIAAYTCTPLVRIPLSELKDGNKVAGTTVAELGNRNRPLDIITYKKGDEEFLLMANSARGVMKISTDDMKQREGIVERISGIAGQPYTTIEELKGVEQLDKLDDKHAVMLIKSEDGTMHIETIALP